MMIMLLACVSCGDSWSETTYSIINKTEYNIILYFKEQGIVDGDSVLCLPNKETIIYKIENRSTKKLYCTTLPNILKEYIEFVIDNGKKHLLKDFFDVNNWECTGDKKSSLIMGGSYYYNVKNVFIITEDDME